MIKAILLDLDGTVYKGSELIEGADLAIENMRRQGIHVFFCTNNSSKLPASIVVKLNKMGIKCDAKDVISSGAIAIKYVKDKRLQKVYVSGSNELIKGFLDEGIDICDETSADTLVIGMDDTFDYEKMTKGLRAAMRSKTIIMCNEDRQFEKEDGIYPGNGGMTSCVLYCSNKQPDVIIGKPSTIMPEYIKKTYGYSKDEMLVIGDSEESDITMAKRFKCKWLKISDVMNKDNIRSLSDTIKWGWKYL